MEDFVIAMREGERQQFTRKVWDLLPNDKCGWVETTAEMPNVVKENLEKAGMHGKGKPGRKAKP